MCHAASSRTADANVGAGSRAHKSRDRRRRGIRDPSIIMEEQRRWGFGRALCKTDQLRLNVLFKWRFDTRFFVDRRFDIFKFLDYEYYLVDLLSVLIVFCF